VRTGIASLLLTLAMLAQPAQAAAPRALELPAAGLSSSPADLRAFLFEPQGPGPHPAVVMIHGCGGAYAKKGGLSPRHQMWGEYLASQGYAALMLDSFSSRGLQQVCTLKHSERPLKEADRVGDAYAALAWLRSRADVDARRIALLGWSHGGGVTLDAIRRKPKGMSEGFAAAVSFYPGCTTRNKKAASFMPYAPLMILIGEADDWTPAAPCKALAETARTNGAPMQIVTYPGAYHDFDNPGIKRVRLRTDVPNGVNPGQGVHTGPDPEAREDAKQRVLAFFKTTLD
jgi:dienelactone hydrolase